MVLTVLAIILVLWGGLAGYNRFMVKRGEAKYPPNGRFVAVEGVRLHYIGKGSGKPVVFLHGGVLSANDFAAVVEMAAERGYHALAFDRPGYGHSERPAKEKVTPIVQARLLHGALRELGVEKPVIVGHSWSGTMVLAYALAYPDEISGIVLLGAAMYKEGYPAENGDPISTLATAPVIGSILLHTLLKSPLLTAAAKKIMAATFAPEPLPEGYLDEALSLWLRPGQFRANREDILAFPPTSALLSGRYNEIKTPTVIVVGEADPFGTIDQAYRLHKDLPHAVLTMLPGVGHMLPQNHPEAVIDALSKLEASRSST
jgi:pimeloyl-ACP methyl ester carboxylesterase